MITRSVDPFSKKDWYDVKAPSMFAVRNVGKTLVTRTQGTKVCSMIGCGRGCSVQAWKLCWQGGCHPSLSLLQAMGCCWKGSCPHAACYRSRQMVPSFCCRDLAMQIASDGLKGRVFDVSLADLQKVSFVQWLERLMLR